MVVVMLQMYVGLVFLKAINFMCVWKGVNFIVIFGKCSFTSIWMDGYDDGIFVMHVFVEYW